MWPISGAVPSTSVFTGATRVTATMRTPWQAKFGLPRLVDDEDEPSWTRELEALLMELDGARNAVRLYDHRRFMPRGVAAGINMGNWTDHMDGQFSDSTVFSDGEGFNEGATTARLARHHYRGERLVLLEGLIPSQRYSLVVGDHLQVKGYLYAARQKVSSDADGKAMVPIHTPLRPDAIKGGMSGRVSFAWPSSPFVMATPFEGLVTTAPNISRGDLQFVEFLPRK